MVSDEVKALREIRDEIKNLTTGAAAKAEPLGDYMMNILQSGGVKPMIRRQLESK